MDVQVVAEVYGGLPERVVTRAREVLRLAQAKSSIQVDLATPVACLVVACRAMEEPVDAKKLAGLLRISARGLDQAARKIAHVVNIKSEERVTPTSLCVRYGCAGITELVNRVYDEYQVVAQHLARGKGGGGTRLFDPSDPVFAAACLFTCAKRAKIRLDRPKLISDVGANPRAFEAIVTSIEASCQQSLLGPVTVSRGVRRSGGAPNGKPITSKNAASDAKTKAAQRAALVLSKAAINKQAKDRETQFIESAEKLKLVQDQSEVTQEQYQAWRSKVLSFRRTHADRGQDLPSSIS